MVPEEGRGWSIWAREAENGGEDALRWLQPAWFGVLFRIQTRNLD
jgi:hypothetical protein